MLSRLHVHRNKFLAGLALLIVCSAGLGIREALSADADQQYNGSAVWADDLTAANAPSADGKRITANSNAVGSAPVNRSLKQLKTPNGGARGHLWHQQRHPSNRKKDLETDSTGGAVSLLLAGGIATTAANDSSLT